MAAPARHARTVLFRPNGREFAAVLHVTSFAKMTSHAHSVGLRFHSRIILNSIIPAKKKKNKPEVID